jgi:hypothetical protein
MKASLIILGVLIAAGLLGGAYILASSKTNSEVYEAKLKLADDRITELEKKTSQLASTSTQHAQELESSRIAIAGSRETIDKMSEELAEATRPAESAELPATESAGSVPGRPLPEAVEAIKETVKRELKEEKLAKEKEGVQTWYREMYKTEAAKFEKKMDERYPELARKIGLNGTQESAIRDIAEDSFDKIMTLMEDAIADKTWEEIDWTAYGKQAEAVGKEHEARINELVDEEQAKALKRFFEDRR